MQIKAQLDIAKKVYDIGRVGVKLSSAFYFNDGLVKSAVDDKRKQTHTHTHYTQF